ncbi:MAG: MbcA/ParS/Xre antitoxin family protein [Pseudoalteromonas distincta]|uniref:MbcA/ParS/Xre antitoxin family protein n=1 Tax=Halopseudomonas aestusnigri TaxID=857252 RepID=UPI002B1CD03B|nr:MbcA/ParS/Xre antitoxin family protein [Halopseudomonas aestusnigri]
MTTNLEIIQQDSQTAKTALTAIFRILNMWHLTDTQQARLLGLHDEKALHNWRAHPESASISTDLIERASYILGIYKSLQILFPNPDNADRWLITCNDNPLFNGQAPIEHMMTGNITDLATVRRCLEALIS